MDEVKHILIGDSDPLRVDRLRKVVESNFAVEISVARSFDELKAKLAEYANRYPVILLSDSLPVSLARRSVQLENYIGFLNEAFPDVNRILVAPERPHLMQAFEREPWIRFPCTGHELREQLGPFFHHLPRPRVVIDGTAQLAEQIRSLTETRQIDTGEVILAQMVARFFDWKTVTVRQLASGMSGALVFRISDAEKDRDAKGAFVLKLAHAGDRWKLELEAKHCEKALTLEHPKREHIPTLRLAERESGTPSVASFGPWCAVCYEYLTGKDFEPLHDLHKVLTAPAHELPASGVDIMAYRRTRLQALLGWLQTNWCTRDAVRELATIWNVEDGDDRSYPTYPPYQVAGRRKAYILSFLSSEDAEWIGPRMFDKWEEHSKRVWDFVSLTEQKDLPRGLQGEFAAVRAHAHGDLNSHNALIWEEHLDQPFFIDFPMYQERGHALQDFARLEVEVRFQLMDQQRGTDKRLLPALGWTWNQIKVWKELDDHLRGANWEDGIACKSDGCTENAEFAYELTLDLRRKAREVQQQDLPDCEPGEFLREYRPALLYHTLCTVGYTLSIFKRLFAVYSASEMLRLLS